MRNIQFPCLEHSSHISPASLFKVPALADSSVKGFFRPNGFLLLLLLLLQLTNLFCVEHIVYIVLLYNKEQFHTHYMRPVVCLSQEKSSILVVQDCTVICLSQPPSILEGSSVPQTEHSHENSNCIDIILYVQANAVLLQYII